jgi:N-methylhydantoinase A
MESLAICLLNSYKNPRHEQQIYDFLIKEFPTLYVSISSEVFPHIREFDRFTTTTINAYVQPMVDRYVERLETGLQQLGFKGKLYIMTSGGGTVTTTTARRFPVRILESGPTAGALMTAHIGRILDLPNLLSYDTGGTSSKGCLIREGLPQKKYESEVARIHEFKPGSGLPVKTPVVDMIEIGAGGGSIAEVDKRGLIQVGPRSAGADPGPACYGQGGKSATLTDANLVLGYLDPDYFVVLLNEALTIVIVVWWRLVVTVLFMEYVSLQSLRFQGCFFL